MFVNYYELKAGLFHFKIKLFRKKETQANWLQESEKETVAEVN